MSERHRSWFEFRWLGCYWMVYYTKLSLCERVYVVCVYSESLPSPLLQNLIQFLCSFRLRWRVCSGKRIYLMKNLRTLLIVHRQIERRSQAKPPSTIKHTHIHPSNTNGNGWCRRQIEMNAKLHYEQVVRAHTHTRPHSLAHTPTHRNRTHREEESVCVCVCVLAIELR